MKIGYKALDNHHNSIVEIVEGKYYPLREWVTPNFGCGPLCIYKSLEDAERNWRHHVHKCLYIEEYRETEVWTKTHRSPLNELPEGTVLARAVYCLE